MFSRSPRLLKLLVLLLGMSFLVSACDTKSVKRRPHEGADLEFQAREEGVKAANQQVEALYAQRESLTEKAGSADTAQEVMAQLEDYILSEEYVETPEIGATLELRTLLGIYNRAFYTLLKTEGRAETLTETIQKYEAAVFDNCSADMKNCDRLGFFRGDHLSSDILIEIAKLRQAGVSALDSASQRDSSKMQEFGSAISNFYRLLYTSFELQNRQENRDVFLLYIRNSQSYLRYFESIDIPSQAVLEQHKRHRDILNIVLARIQEQKSSNPEAREDYCEFVIGSKPYAFGKEHSNHLDRRNLQNFMAEFVQCSKERRQLKGLISNYLKERETEKKSAIEVDTGDSQVKFHPSATTSYFQAETELDRSPFLYNSLGLKKIETSSLQFYVIEMLYYEAIDQRTASLLLSNISGLDDNAFLDMIENFMKIQMAHLIRATYIDLGEYFREEYKEKGLATDLFSNAVKYLNSRIQFDWEIYKLRSSFIRTLLLQNFDSKYNRVVRDPALKPIAQKYRVLKEKLEHLKDHIDYVITEPLMLALNYYMARSQGSIKFHVSWWPGTNQYFDIDASSTLTNFFLGDREAFKYRLFKFGNKRFEFERFQKFHAFEYALRGGLFEFFPFDLLEEDEEFKLVNEEGTSLNNEYFFFKEFIEDFFSATRRKFETEIDKLNILEVNRDFTDRFMDACVDPFAASIVLTTGELYYSTLTADKDLFEGIMQIYGVTGHITNYRMNFKFVERIIDILEVHLNSSDRVPSEKNEKAAEILAKIDLELEAFRKLERELFRKIFEFDRRVVTDERNCLDRLYKAEFYRRDKIYQANINFYRNVHAAMSLLRVYDGSELTLNSVDSLANKWFEEAKSNNSELSKAQNYTSVMSLIGDQSTESLLMDVKQRITDLGKEVIESGLLDHFKAQGLADKALRESLNYLLGIHNVHISPFRRDGKDDLGFIVEGILPESVLEREIKRLNLITSGEFTQGRWDTTMRIRHMMNNLIVERAEAEDAIGGTLPGDSEFIALAPNVDIPIGSIGELERNSLYTGNKTDRVAYSTHPYIFVQTAMSQMGGQKRGGDQYLGWHSGSGLKLDHLKTRRGFLAEMSTLGAIETKDTDPEKCRRDIWGEIKADKTWQNKPLYSGVADSECGAVRIPIREVIEDYIQFTNSFIKLNDPTIPSDQLAERLGESPQVQIVNWLDREGRFIGEAKKMFQFKSEPSTREWTWFDEFIRNRYTGVEGRTMTGAQVRLYYLAGRAAFERFIDLKLKKIDINIDLFPFNEQVNQLERDYYRQHFTRGLGYYLEATKYIRKLEDEKRDLGDVVFERTQTPLREEDLLNEEWRYVHVKKRTEGPRSDTPIYLRDDKDSNFSAYESFLKAFFNIDSDCKAYPRAGDPDWPVFEGALSSISDCKQRYEAYMERFREVSNQDNYEAAPGGF